MTSVHSDGKFYIETLKPDGQLVSSHPIQYPQEIPNFRRIFPNFSSIDDQLIFSTGRQLFTLSLEGQITNISLTLDEPMGTPVFHPNGQQMIAIKGHYDSDIISFSLAELSHAGQLAESTDLTSEPKIEDIKNYKILERSTLAEDYAIFQPKGNLLAFRSERSGDEQIWIANKQGVRQLSNFPMDTFLYGMAWVADGESILVNANRKMKQIFIDGIEKDFILEFPIETLFHWDSINQTALINVWLNGILKFAEVDLATSNIRVINEKQVNWAQKSEDGQIVYTDHMDRFWQPGAIEDQLIEVLNEQGSRMRFLLKDQVIYGINENFQLWSYRLNENDFQIIGAVPRTIDNLSDINETQVLATLRIASRKEVAELFLNR